MHTILEHEAPGLFRRLESASQEQRRRAIVVACGVVGRSLPGLRPVVRELLQTLQDRGTLSRHELATAQALAEKADDEYLELQKREEEESALQRFSEARLLTAIAIGVTETSLARSAEAAYELCKACDDPSTVVASIVSTIQP